MDQTAKRTPDWKPQWSLYSTKTPSSAELTHRTLRCEGPHHRFQTRPPRCTPHILTSSTCTSDCVCFSLSCFPASQRDSSAAIKTTRERSYTKFLLIQHPAWGISPQKKSVNEACFSGLHRQRIPLQPSLHNTQNCQPIKLGTCEIALQLVIGFTYGKAVYFKNTNPYLQLIDSRLF